MLGIKRLYTFILQTFLPLFLLTFGICLFIVLMQFLWKYIDDLVGKGIEISLLLEMFFYAGIVLVPMALPLSILLASLMTFGNLGESFELTAIKASGVSLLRTMRPVMLTIVIVATGAYFFQNNVMPFAKVKMHTLLLSMKHKSPELDIPEGSFYKEIPGYNLYVKKKDLRTGLLYDMMIYDFSKGFENATVIVADSGRLKMSADKKNLILTLYRGDSFENLREQQPAGKNKSIAYRRENFDRKEVLIEFDSNFNMMDESMMQGQFIGKNKTELRQFIDSASVVSDSINAAYAQNLKENVYRKMYRPLPQRGSSRSPSPGDGHEKVAGTVRITNFDACYASMTAQKQQETAFAARSRVDNISGEYQFRAMQQEEQANNIRRHEIELNQKYTLSFACLVFLFIGAPLGAIIRKGGLGMPVVVSVFFFIFYYIIDTFGAKMAREGIWPVWEGIWLSSSVLFPLGIFLTYKAVNDSIIFNPDAYLNAFRKMLGKRDTRDYAVKEVIMQYPDYPACLDALSALNGKCDAFVEHHQKMSGCIDFRKMDFTRQELKDIIALQESLIDDLRNSDSHLVIVKLMDYPVVPVVRSEFPNRKIFRRLCAVVFPLGLAFYFIALCKRKKRVQDVMLIKNVNEELIQCICSIQSKKQ
jgi:lipopolysaccharide export system permease protein